MRDELDAMGIALKDNKDGTTSWEPKAMRRAATPFPETNAAALLGRRSAVARRNPPCRHRRADHRGLRRGAAAAPGPISPMTKKALGETFEKEPEPRRPRRRRAGRLHRARRRRPHRPALCASGGRPHGVASALCDAIEKLAARAQARKRGRSTPAIRRNPVRGCASGDRARWCGIAICRRAPQHAFRSKTSGVGNDANEEELSP